MRPCNDKKVPYYQGRLYMPVQICSSKVFLFYTDFIHQNIEFFIKAFFSPQLYKEVGSYFLAVLSWISALQEWIQGKDICQFSELPYPPIKILKLVISWSLHHQKSLESFSISFFIKNINLGAHFLSFTFFDNINF